MHALLRLHAELGGRIKQNRDQAKRLASDMKAVEAVIKMLEPAYNVRHIAARRRNKSNPWFRRGEGYRYALDVLRKAEGPLTVREIAERMVALKGVTDATPKQIRDLAAASLTSLRNHQGQTVVKVGEGVPGRWRLVS